MDACSVFYAASGKQSVEMVFSEFQFKNGTFRNCDTQTEITSFGPLHHKRK